MSIAQIGAVCSKFGDKEKLRRNYINKGEEEKPKPRKKKKVVSEPVVTKEEQATEVGAEAIEEAIALNEVFEEEFEDDPEMAKEF